MNLEIANRLQKLRKEKGYSQEQLAEALGISRQAVSKWERAESSPDTDNLICLAKLYGVSLDELLSTDESVKEIVENNEPEMVKEMIVKEHRKIKHLENLLIFAIVVIYFILGFAFDLWHPGWIVFLFVPIILSLIEAIKSKNPHQFAYPVLLVAIYLFLGTVYHLWHPMWVLFITIPVYYGIVDVFVKDDEDEDIDE